MTDKLTGLDMIRQEKLSDLNRLAREIRESPDKLVSHLQTFTALTPNELVNTIMRALGGQYIVDNLKKFTELEHSKIAELLMQKAS